MEGTGGGGKRLGSPPAAAALPLLSTSSESFGKKRRSKLTQKIKKVPLEEEGSFSVLSCGTRLMIYVALGDIKGAERAEKLEEPSRPWGGDKWQKEEDSFELSHFLE